MEAPAVARPSTRDFPPQVNIVPRVIDTTRPGDSWMLRKMAQAKWIPFRPSSAPPNTPDLLVRASFTENSFDVCLTDLSNVWHHVADRRQIFRQALNDDNCSIDPTEGDSQLRILLRKIQSALEHEEGTRRVLLSDVRASDQRAIQLQVMAPLPAPLDPLSWNIEFRLEPPETVKNEVVLPLASSMYALQTSVGELIHHLKEKDHVIDKLIDKLESSGVELVSVFPGISGVKTPKGSGQRATAARHIKGLSIFNKEEWQSTFKEKCKAVPPLHQIFSNLTEDLEVSESRPYHDDQSAQNGNSAINGQATKADAPSPGNDTTDDNDEDAMDFQRQPTPPALRKRAEAKKAQKQVPPSSSFTLKSEHAQGSDEETTDGEDDLDAPGMPVPSKETHSTLANQTRSTTPPEQKRSGLGTGGGRSSEPISSPKNGVDQPKGERDGDSTTDGEEDLDVPKPSVEPFTSPAKAPMPLPRRSKLGMIGGGKRPVSDRASSRVHDLESTPEPIVARGSSTLSATTRRELAVTPSKAPSKVTTPARSSQERADEEREKLKRELEAKARAPAKKKRKF